MMSVCLSHVFVKLHHVFNWRFYSLSCKLSSQLILDMPKDKSFLAPLREKRVKDLEGKKVKLNSLWPSVFHLHVLGNGGKGNPRGLYVSSDHRCYLFNCGEGTQRLAHEHRLKLSKLEHIFFTRSSSDNMNGMIGLSLTCQDIGVPSFTFHGPLNTKKCFDLYRPFFTSQGLQIIERTHLEGRFEDSVMTVDYVVINRSNEENNSRKGDEHVAKKVKVIEDEVESETEDISLAYICKIKNKPGELMINKCKQLNIKPGPWLGKLKSGEDAEVDGKIIKSSDVVAPEEKGLIFMVLECPSLDFIDSLVSNSQFHEYQTSSSESWRLTSVLIHFSPSEVLNDVRYQNWMSLFGEHVVHLLCDEESPTLANVSTNRLQTQLSLIDASVFPLLKGVNQEERKDDLKTIKKVRPPSLLRYNIRPSANVGLDEENVVTFDAEQFKKEALASQGFAESVQEYKRKVSCLSSSTSSSSSCPNISYPQVIFLGTGSAIPSKDRNTSAILINLTEQTSIVFDCGEGTCGQLYRFYGPEFESQLSKIKAIYVSHFHADHHLGMLSLMKRRASVTSDVLTLIVPHVVRQWLLDYHQQIEPINHLYKSYACDMFSHLEASQPNEIVDELLPHLGLKELRTCLVKHCRDAHGISVTTNKEPHYKIVYSGDAMPTPQLVEIGMDCDLLIHEATMEDELLKEAQLKMHCTTSEAIEMGIKMKAQFTILTHFSQRYSKLPLFNEMFSDKVGVAFDNMQISMNHLPSLALMIPSIRLLFNEYYEDLQARTAHKQRKRKLLSQYLGEV